MKAVIPAAGMGTRVSTLTGADPKGLMRIGSRRLIEHILLSARTGGVKEFVIVTGYQRDAIPAALGDGSTLGVSIEYIYNPRWHDLANGYSILTAEPLLTDPFVILMSDHLFEPPLLKALLATPPPTGGCRLLTDSRINNVFDIDDATKVKTDGAGRILELGKNLVRYDRIDTGLFYSTKGLCDAIRLGLERGESSLTFGNNHLAAANLMLETIAPTNTRWLDVDTPASVTEALGFPGI